MEYIAYLGLLLLAALNILQLVFGYIERKAICDRIQSRTLSEYKHFEAAGKKETKKEPQPDQPDLL